MFPKLNSLILNFGSNYRIPKNQLIVKQQQLIDTFLQIKTIKKLQLDFITRELCQKLILLNLEELSIKNCQKILTYTYPQLILQKIFNYEIYTTLHSLHLYNLPEVRYDSFNLSIMFPKLHTLTLNFGSQFSHCLNTTNIIPYQSQLICAFLQLETIKCFTTNNVSKEIFVKFILTNLFINKQISTTDPKQLYEQIRSNSWKTNEFSLSLDVLNIEWNTAIYYKFPINNIKCTTFLKNDVSDYSMQWKNLIIQIVLKEDLTKTNKNCAVKHENIYFAFNIR
jgi:hypothetical protein